MGRGVVMADYQSGYQRVALTTDVLIMLMVS